jgi:uncharacterized membrane protein YgaE (UPF0421/DUF939 family)
MIQFDERLQVLGSPNANTPSQFLIWYRTAGFIIGLLVAAIVVALVRSI